MEGEENGMNIKEKISKKIALRLALFVAVIGLASLFDIYFDDKHVEIEETEANSPEDEKEQGTILLISQSTNLGAKTSVNKTVVRTIQLKSHDKYIQKYYQLRNYQVLRAEVQNQTAPLINSYHYLAFKNYFYSVPDDVPINS
jgi:flagellar basal body-associated protein FliL